jgi:magnesium-transporting ATPase (P-type)
MLDQKQAQTFVTGRQLVSALALLTAIAGLVSVGMLAVRLAQTPDLGGAMRLATFATALLVFARCIRQHSRTDRGRPLRWTGARPFWATWVGFTVFFVLLQYVFNHAAGLFAIAMSALAAIPVSAMLYYADKRRKTQS